MPEKPIAILIGVQCSIVLGVDLSICDMVKIGPQNNEWLAGRFATTHSNQQPTASVRIE